MLGLSKWWRVELDASGAILKCSEVEAAERGTGSVRYIEALSAAEACSYAKAWDARHKAAMRECHAKRYAERKAAGRCVRCGAPGDAGHVLCARHRKADAERRRYGGETTPRIKHTPEQALAAHRKVDARYQRRNGKGKPFRKCLKQLDALGPEAFRAWLVAEIERLSNRE
jgi:hypothetical protein